MKTLMFYRKTPRKTRIKVIKKRNGYIEYVAQYKGISGWRDFSIPSSLYPFDFDIFSPVRTLYHSFGMSSSTEIEKVKLLIDDYIKFVEEAVQKRYGDKVVSKTYIDYP